LKGEELRGIIERGKELAEGMPVRAYLAMVLRANGSKLEEVAGMPGMTLEEVLEKHGFIAKWEARGREEGLEKGLEKGQELGLEKGRKEVVKRLRKHGMDPAEISEALELPLNTVIKYLNAE
jgi:predicted transposase YdaD